MEICFFFLYINRPCGLTGHFFRFFSHALICSGLCAVPDPRGVALHFLYSKQCAKVLKQHYQRKITCFLPFSSLPQSLVCFFYTVRFLLPKICADVKFSPKVLESTKKGRLQAAWRQKLFFSGLLRGLRGSVWGRPSKHSAIAACTRHFHGYAGLIAHTLPGLPDQAHQCIAQILQFPAKLRQSIGLCTTGIAELLQLFHFFFNAATQFARARPHIVQYPSCCALLN